MNKNNNSKILECQKYIKKNSINDHKQEFIKIFQIFNQRYFKFYFLKYDFNIRNNKKTPKYKDDYTYNFVQFLKTYKSLTNFKEENDQNV